LRAFPTLLLRFTAALRTFLGARCAREGVCGARVAGGCLKERSAWRALFSALSNAVSSSSSFAVTCSSDNLFYYCFLLLRFTPIIFGVIEGGVVIFVFREDFFLKKNV
jgi:hypothetical protein